MISLWKREYSVAESLNCYVDLQLYSFIQDKIVEKESKYLKFNATADYFIYFLKIFISMGT